MPYLSALFWAFFAAYVVHILDETLLNGGFVRWIADNFWPSYHARMFFWFNTGDRGARGEQYPVRQLRRPLGHPTHYLDCRIRHARLHRSSLLDRAPQYLFTGPALKRPLHPHLLSLDQIRPWWTSREQRGFYHRDDCGRPHHRSFLDGGTDLALSETHAGQAMRN